MSNPTPAGGQIPGSPQGGEQPPQWGGTTNPAYDTPPQYQPYQQPYQPAGAPPYSGYPPQYVPGMNPTNAMAIASFIVSLVGLGLIGVILGHIALSQINRSNGYEQGRGFAIAGLIIGYAEIALGLLMVFAFLGLILIAPATTAPAN